MPSRRNNQLFALRQPPPQVLTAAGASYRLVRVFKHDFFAATCLYESAAGTAVPRIVVKFGRVQGFCGLPMRWLGRLTAGHEQAVYRALEGVAGLPRWVERIDDCTCAIEYIEAIPLDHVQDPSPTIFGQLRAIFDAIHARGVAYTDANKRSNILIDHLGRPWLIDFQLAVRRRDDLPWPLGTLAARLVAYLAAKDIYHLYKHKRRLCPQALTPQEHELSLSRGWLHRLHRMLTKPYRSLRREFLAKQHQSGRLVSPTSALEDRHQPEKATWRKP